VLLVCYLFEANVTCVFMSCRENVLCTFIAERRRFYVYARGCCTNPGERVYVCFMEHLTFTSAFAFCNLGITTKAVYRNQKIIFANGALPRSFYIVQKVAKQVTEKYQLTYKLLIILINKFDGLRLHTKHKSLRLINEVQIPSGD
jgi:hypothetical protein